MITRISGTLIETKEQALVIDVQGLFYEVVVPASVIQRIESTRDEKGHVNLVTYHYFQIGPSSGVPILIGFMNEIERDFFLQFIKVSGIGPRAAVRALNQPIADITTAIDSGDHKFLTTLPGIGTQRAKEIVAKLQGKVGKYGLIQDRDTSMPLIPIRSDWQDEALSVLLQLQYRKQEAEDMIHKAMTRTPDLKTTESLLNEIYKQKVKG